MPNDDWRTFTALSLPPILQHSLAAFSAQGYEATTVREIARRVGVTVPTIYYHYESKQDLLVTLLSIGIEEVLWRSEAALSTAGSDPTNQLDHVVEAIVLYEAYRRDLAFLDSEIRSLEPAERERYVARRDQLEHMVVDIIVTGRQSGALATAYPVACSRAILAMCQGVATWYRPNRPLAPETIASQYTLFARGAARVLST